MTAEAANVLADLRAAILPPLTSRLSHARDHTVLSLTPES